MLCQTCQVAVKSSPTNPLATAVSELLLPAVLALAHFTVLVARAHFACPLAHRHSAKIYSSRSDGRAPCLAAPTQRGDLSMDRSSPIAA